MSVLSGEGADEGAFERFREGDREAFGSVFDAYAQVVYRFCWRRTSLDPGVDAEDLMSVVFLEAWAARERSVLVDGSLRPWLLGVANNVVRNHRRSVRRHRAALARVPAELHTAGPEDQAAAHVDGAALMARTLQALERLSDKEREVIELCAFEGLDTATVATLLRVPHGTVKSRLARARQHLATLSHPGDMADPRSSSGQDKGERATRAPVLKGVAWNR